MNEKSFEINDLNPLDFFGVNDVNIESIRKFFPKLKIIARGNIVKAVGDDEELMHFENKYHYLILHCEKFGKLNSSDIKMILNSKDKEIKESLNNQEDVLVHGTGGKLIRALTVNQRKMVESCYENDLVFAIGPAGTGKTYTAVAIAVKALKNREVKRIVLTRPAVEAGENLGFLPGDLRDKLDPYLQPIYDALRDMLPHQKLLSYLEEGTIEIAPLAFMRGRTLNNAFVILDEAQNTTNMQLKMFLTRMGKSAKFVVTGDITQIDLPKHQSSGLVQSKQLLEGIKGIEFVMLDERDVVRHQLVTKIIKAYDSISRK
ncbi:MAG: PhoH family protein [Saprospiraceae bacterium]|nr:PhoH family protein [Saprospiraceae bacterium]